MYLAVALLLLATAVGLLLLLWVAPAVPVSPEALRVLPFQSGHTPTEHTLSRFHVRWNPATLLFLAFDVQMVLATRSVALGALALALEDAAQRLVVRPAFALAWVLDAVRRKAVEPVPGSIAAAGRRLAQALAGFDVHVIVGAVSLTASGVRSLAERARRPQTRQLHQYYLQDYLQAVIVAVVAMALLVTSGLAR